MGLTRLNRTERRMTAQERAAALDYLRQDIQLSEELIGRDLGEWKKV